ncbi:MAG: DNA polymerase III subunit gamma/tau, partial [Gammaproteobacteria bacterium]|nr:DNA polymerase III subunit gamma/tau [Gammaproteobacteria bacterium]
MSYQVLARKWRPRNFAEMVGQEHVLKALINALDHNRLHHAFLFAGTRGVGKTTLARILAKCLNCERGVSSRPCGECSACREIEAGRFVDLIEVDAASRTKVDDTRELLDNVQYAPSRGRYKVYLIDEVHMLSGHSFNALLKTLEEPPPHVKFLLATTDPQKLPVTVLSRCLQFNLKRLPVSLMQKHLAHILEAEGIAGEDAAIALIAQAADGSLRDALSLLDQAIAYGAGALRVGEVRSMLGSIEQTHVLSLLQAVANKDGKALLEIVGKLDELAPDYETILGDLASCLQRVALAQALPEAPADLAMDDAVRILGGGFTPEQVQLCYQIALFGKRDLALAPSPRGGFEMTLLRMLAFIPVQAETVRAPASAAAAARAAGTAQSAAARPNLVSKAAQTWKDPDWIGLVESLELRGAAQQLALNCQYRQREANTLHLELDTAHAHLATEQLIQRLQEAIARHYGEPLKIRIQAVHADLDTPAKRDARRQAENLQAAQAAIAADPNVRNLC